MKDLIDYSFSIQIKSWLISRKKQLIMAETRSSFSESSSAEHQGGTPGDDADDLELLQRLERIE